MPGTPRIGFNLVDVRDVADLQHRRFAERRDRQKPVRFVGEIDVDLARYPRPVE